MMAWGVNEHGNSMGPELPHALEAVRWATDYFLKSTAAAPAIIYAQVGDPNADHNCWQRPEDMDTPRTVYAVTPDKPGTEVAAETAAALAAASLAFRAFGDEAYGKVLLERAVEVFEFADKYRGSYNDSIGEGVCPFYCSYSGYQDELLWGAAWLYKATSKVYYWNYVKKNVITFKSNIEAANFEFSWDSKHAGISVLVSNWVLKNNKEASTTPFLSYADSFMCSLMPESPTKNVQFTADYILGSNPLNMSYMVGYGAKFPRRMHHRGSSILSLDQRSDHIGCQEWFPNFNNTSPNPNELTGAVSRGPEIDDSFADARANSSKSEPTTYIVGKAKLHDYGDALSKSLLFFEGQRSGKLPSTQRVRWRKDSGLRDGFDKGVDLTGGYYDAGDNVKYNFPMAFTITMMAWGVIEHGNSMGKELPHALEAVRWATDYFLKSTAAAPGIIYAQVGDPNADHNCWQRPEDMDTPRTVYAVTPNKPGTEVAAETAAALAAASLAFRAFGDEAYGKVLLERAVKVFEFADKYRGSYNDSIGEGDGLLWGAAWLYKATNKVYYWNYVKKNVITFKSNIEAANFEFSWDSKHAGISVLVSNWVLKNNKEASTTPFLSYADSFMCSLMPESPTKNVQFTAGNVL
ncbi:hypothetical protein SASPL_116165 [Salvia splendens]|uniref:Endoglucanase n=1 Tax=Salvia splendens TaxID=180675 RepID=A0A8X8Y6D7_SALSN|nr:hypothetical protein SASPL_116165 [Salvia splendens]